MVLPILNDKPKYVMTLPSTGKEIKYRPYLVREEKILMVALESQDKSAAMNAIVDTIAACIYSDIDKNALTVFDIEYMFLKIRSKSVGEKIQIGLKCTNCEKVNEVEVDIEQLPLPEVENKEVFVDITDDIVLKMKYPNFRDMAELEKNTILSDTDKTFKLIISCMDSIQTNDENILIKDEKEANVMNFIESLNTTQFNRIKDYVEAMPRVEYDIDFKCTDCGTENHGELRGVEDFF